MGGKRADHLTLNVQAAKRLIGEAKSDPTPALPCKQEREQGNRRSGGCPASSESKAIGAMQRLPLRSRGRSGGGAFDFAAKSGPTPALPCMQGREQGMHRSHTALRAWAWIRARCSRRAASQSEKRSMYR